MSTSRPAPIHPGAPECATPPAIARNTAHAADMVGTRDRFVIKTGSLTGAHWGAGMNVRGFEIACRALPAAYRDALRRELETNPARRVYVVQSYGIPIAWEVTGGRVMVPTVRYSTTTSVHQHAIVDNTAGAAWLNLPGAPGWVDMATAPPLSYPLGYVREQTANRPERLVMPPRADR